MCHNQVMAVEFEVLVQSKKIGPTMRHIHQVELTSTNSGYPQAGVRLWSPSAVLAVDPNISQIFVPGGTYKVTIERVRKENQKDIPIPLYGVVTEPGNGASLLN